MSLPTQLVAIAVLKDMLTEADTALRAQILKQMLPTDRQSAVTYDAEGEPVQVGSVTRKKLEPGGKPTVSVADYDALIKWCRKHAPDEVETVFTVRPAFAKRLLQLAEIGGGYVDHNGELSYPDGVVRSTTAPSGGGLMVNKTDDGPDLIRAEILAGRLTFADVLALPAGTP